MSEKEKLDEIKRDVDITLAKLREKKNELMMLVTQQGDINHSVLISYGVLTRDLDRVERQFGIFNKHICSALSQDDETENI